MAKSILAGPTGPTHFIREIADSTLVPPVVSTGFKLFNKPVPIGTDGLILTRAINETETLTLDHDQSVFSFELRL